jgi:MFS family permease
VGTSATSYHVVRGPRGSPSHPGAQFDTDRCFLVVLFSCAVLFANSGGGILNFVYRTELFPTHLRAGASGLATSVSRIGSILGVLTFPNFVAWWGASAALWCFFAIASLGLVISVWLAPETKNLSLYELNATEFPGTVLTALSPQRNRRQGLANYKFDLVEFPSSGINVLLW